MKTHLLLKNGLFVCPFLFSQILTVNDGSSVSISSGSSITLNHWKLHLLTLIQLIFSNDLKFATAAIPCRNQ